MATINLTVTVENYAEEGDRFKIDGAKRPNLFFVRGNTYVFDVSDDSVAGHQFQFAETADGVGGGYTTGVTVSGAAGDTGATVTIVVAGDAPETLFYYCGVHAGMADQAKILVSGVSLIAHAVDAFATDVTIFANTIAREIPTKVQSIAVALKDHTNTELGDITNYTNASWNSVLTDLQKFASDVAKEQVVFEGGLQDLFENLQASLGNYLADEASYTRAQIDTTLFTGGISSTNISHDSDGRLTSIKANGKLIWNITYDDDGFLEGFRETIQIGGYPITKVYNVITDADGLIEAIEDITE
jgi:hypothetical protein